MTDDEENALEEELARLERLHGGPVPEAFRIPFDEFCRRLKRGEFHDFFHKNAENQENPNDQED